MEITKTLQRPQYSKTSLYSDHSQGQIKFTIEDGKDNEKLSQIRHDGPFENTLRHLKSPRLQSGPPPCKVAQCTGFHTPRVLTKRYLRTDISIVITPTLLSRLNY